MPQKKGRIHPKKIVKEKIKSIKKVASPVDNLPVVSQKQFNERKFAFRSILVGVFTVTTILAILARRNPYFPLDLTITREIQDFTPFWFDMLMNLITFVGNLTTSIILTTAVVGFIFLKKRTKEAVMLTVSTTGSGIIAIILKALIHRPRPNPELIHQLRPFLKPDSFPSGHVLFYVGFFGFLFYLAFILPTKNRYRLALLITFGVLLILIGPSRIYLGAHWFSDVMGAYLIGFLWLVVIISAYNKWHPKVKER